MSIIQVITQIGLLVWIFWFYTVKTLQSHTFGAKQSVQDIVKDKCLLDSSKADLFGQTTALGIMD